ncbi:hypothetical protein Y695_03093 [Hydrogenophaga sp. T4]|nr:hypothetical protein Y695_03093 [Hydrogenophaga sp. T4]
MAPLHHALDHQRDQGQQGQQRGDGKRGHRLVLVVEHLDVQRHGVGLAADVARDHAHGTELAHGARVAQDHAVDQAPLDVGQGHAPEGLPAGGAQNDGGLFFVVALGLHQRDQLACDEGEGHEEGGEDDAGHGEHDLDVVRHQPGAEPALRAEDQHIDQARHHRRDRERQVDQRGQEGLAPELVLGNRPGRGNAERQVQRHGHGGGEQRQADRRPGIGFLERFPVGVPALAKGFGEHGRQRQHQEQEHEHQRDAGQRPADPGRFGGAALGAANSVLAHCEFPAERLRCQPCNPLITSRSANEITSITVATAVAPA